MVNWVDALLVCQRIIIPKILNQKDPTNSHLRLCLGVWREEEGRALTEGEKYRRKLINLSHFLKEYLFKE